MIAWLSRDWPFLLATVVVAALVHAASVLAIPRLVMGRAMDRMARHAGINTMTHTPRADAQSRAIVRPSPDLLYSSCAYDLGKLPGGVLHVHASAMPATYWSVSVFDADTDNIYVLNDRQAKNGGVDFLLVGSGGDTPNARGLPQVWSPTARGIVLFRTLINDETRFAEIDAARKHAACEPYAPG
jgi:uncharacterized membrane protein